MPPTPSPIRRPPAPRLPRRSRYGTAPHTPPSPYPRAPRDQLTAQPATRPATASLTALACSRPTATQPTSGRVSAACRRAVAPRAPRSRGQGAAGLHCAHRRTGPRARSAESARPAVAHRDAHAHGPPPAVRTRHAAGGGTAGHQAGHGLLPRPQADNDTGQSQAALPRQAGGPPRAARPRPSSGQRQPAVWRTPCRALARRSADRDTGGRIAFAWSVRRSGRVPARSRAGTSGRRPSRRRRGRVLRGRAARSRIRRSPRARAKQGTPPPPALQPPGRACRSGGRHGPPRVHRVHSAARSATRSAAHPYAHPGVHPAARSPRRGAPATGRPATRRPGDGWNGRGTCRSVPAAPRHSSPWPPRNPARPRPKPQ